MRSLNLNFLKSIRLDQAQASSLKKLGEYKGKQALFARQTPEILQSLKQLAKVESAESSNRIEGVVAPQKRVQALVLDSVVPENRSEQEIAGYRDALSMMHESSEYLSFSNATIQQIHSVMYRYLPDEGGKWKHKNNEIVDINPDGSRALRFSPVTADGTPDTMETLAQNYGRAIDESDIEPLIAIPLAILDFLCVHPFADGNGRVSRLLTLLLLYQQDYQVGRFISLERIVEESKTTYYEALKHCSQEWHEGKHDCHPWLNYFWGDLLRAYSEFEERVGEIRTTKLSKTAQIRMAVERRIGPFAISDIERECPHISRDMIKLVLRDLRDEGAIVVQGKGRGAKWIRGEAAVVD